MIPERVPGQLADQPVILVQVVARVRQDELRVDPFLQGLERVLHLGGHVRQVPVAKGEDLDGGGAGRVE